LVKIFGKPDAYNAFISDKKSGVLKYSEVKKALSHDIAEYFSDFRKKKNELMENPKHLEKILEQGVKKARLVAEKTMEEVRKKVGLTR
jgi:tryptophanyl-tRNA synthetase